ncbi:MAG: glycerophosphodiester phosphodiesterase [Candidatus Binatia bacterium]
MLAPTQPLLTTTLPCWVIGHRGAAAVCPENTLPSFLTARDVGAGIIELDVQQSTDGELFVFHDDTLARLCGESLSVASLSWDELSSKIVGRWQSLDLTMPRLTEVFTSLHRSTFYNIELKTDTVHYPRIEARLAALVAAYGLRERVLVSSFYHESLRLLRQHDRFLCLGMLLDATQADRYGSPAAIVTGAQELACLAVHPEYKIVRRWPELVSFCHAAGLRVFPWTVDEPTDWYFLVHEVNVDGIITNDPGRLYEWLLTQ